MAGCSWSGEEREDGSLAEVSQGCDDDAAMFVIDTSEWQCLDCAI